MPSFLLWLLGPTEQIVSGLKLSFLLLYSSSHICPDVKRSVESSFPHYGHSGIVEAARDLYMQLEGNLANNGNHDFFLLHYPAFLFINFKSVLLTKLS
jgi:hypothetical protein